MNKRLKKYCVGCGLCQSMKKGCVEEDKKGFYHPVDGDEQWMKRICVAYGAHQNYLDSSDVWGKHIKVNYGWSLDNKIRKNASSGGVITSLCCYLLEYKKVDAIIHVCENKLSPTETETCISESIEEICERAGSRYSISSPLNIIGKLDSSKVYAFVGKPCDVDILRNYARLNPNIDRMIPYMISFFCMGVPSKTAQSKLLRALNCPSNDCVSLRYRGDGWPGYATAVDSTGKRYKMDYDSSWGNILGRDLMPMCRWCLNGLGESADISMGDAWYLDSMNKPIFAENEGRNVIFSRTEKGLEILKEAVEKNYIHVDEECNYKNDLKYMQYAQYDRRVTMLSRIVALKMLFVTAPKYKVVRLVGYAKEGSIKKQYSSFKGTVKRVLLKKL